MPVDRAEESFKDILSAFSAAGVDYLVVGAYAMARTFMPEL